jgi:hypothetical protein
MSLSRRRWVESGIEAARPSEVTELRGEKPLHFVAAMEEVEICPATLLVVDWFKLERTAVTKCPPLSWPRG